VSRPRYVALLRAIAERLLAGVRVTAPSQEIQSGPEAIEDLGGRENVRPPRRQLHGEGEVVQPPAELRHDRVGLQARPGRESMRTLKPEGSARARGDACSGFAVLGAFWSAKRSPDDPGSR
jgi:hypothetical protein